MTSLELLRYQLDDAWFQIEKIAGDFPIDAFDVRPIASMMSPREILAHLCEVYVAAVSTSKGGKHRWGSFVPEETSRDGLLAECKRLRTLAAEAVLVDDESRLRLGTSYVVGHDYYHVGQLAAARLAVEPSWDAHSIYR